MNQLLWFSFCCPRSSSGNSMECNGKIFKSVVRGVPPGTQLSVMVRFSNLLSEELLQKLNWVFLYSIEFSGGTQPYLHPPSTIVGCRGKIRENLGKFFNFFQSTIVVHNCAQRHLPPTSGAFENWQAIKGSIWIFSHLWMSLWKLLSQKRTFVTVTKKAGYNYTNSLTVF